MENALAADRERQWKAQSSPESESEGTEGRTIVSTSRPRSRKASGVGNRVPKGPRKRGDTVTSVRTATTRRDSIGTARSGSSAKHPEEVRTPTRAETNPSAVKKVSSDVNPPPPPPSKTTTTTVTTIAKNDDYDDDASVSEVATATTDQPTTPALTPG